MQVHIADNSCIFCWLKEVNFRRNIWPDIKSKYAMIFLFYRDFYL